MTTTIGRSVQVLLLAVMCAFQQACGFPRASRERPSGASDDASVVASEVLAMVRASAAAGAFHGCPKVIGAFRLAARIRPTESSVIFGCAYAFEAEPQRLAPTPAFRGDVIEGPRPDLYVDVSRRHIFGRHVTKFGVYGWPATHDEDRASRPVSARVFLRLPSGSCSSRTFSNGSSGDARYQTACVRLIANGEQMVTVAFDEPNRASARDLSVAAEALLLATPPLDGPT